MHNTENHILNQQGQPALVASFFVIESVIRFIDMFSGIGGFREGLTRAGGFTCVGHCEIDKYANRSYNALFDTKGEWFVEDARKADPETMPEFQLLCGGFPCQAFSTAGSRKGFGDPRGTLFFELARLAEARKPAYLLFENVPGLLKPGAPMHTLTTKDRHGVLCEGRIRRLTPRECLRLQGWADDRIDTVLAIQSDNQAYKQAGNGVTVHVVEVIGRRIAAMDAELRGEALAP